MENELTIEELLAVYGGSQVTSWNGVPYVYDIDGTPLQGQALNAYITGHGDRIAVNDVTVGVRLGDKIYDLPGDNPLIAGPY